MMKKHLTLLSLTLLGSLIAVEPEISFSFDKNLNADKAFVELNGKTKVANWRAMPAKSCIDEGKLLSVPGLQGNALQIGTLPEKKGNNIVQYYLKNEYLSAKEGTLSFWMKPDGWDGYASSGRVFIRFCNSTQPGPETLVVDTVNKNGAIGIRVLQGILRQGFSYDSISKKTDWNKGEWHHIAVTWNNGKTSLYLDGRYAAGKTIPQLKTDFRLLNFGETWYKTPGSTYLDEVRLFRKALNDAEIDAEYQRFAKKATGNKRAFEVKVSSRTPKIDGVVQPGEYAAGFSLMRERPRRHEDALYSEEQPQTYLSYDKDNVYFAMISDGNIRRYIKDHDGNVWEDDSVEFLVSQTGTKTEVFHIIINADGVVYDSREVNGVGNTKWDLQGAKINSILKDGKWIIEAAIPWSNFKIAPKDGESFYFNICRNFRGAFKSDFAGTFQKKRDGRRKCGVSISSGFGFMEADGFGKFTFDAGVPAFELMPLGDLVSGKLDTKLYLYPETSGKAAADISTGNTEKAFRFHSDIPFDAGKTVCKNIAGNCDPSGKLKVKLSTDKAGEFLYTSVAYTKPVLLKFKSFTTDIPKKELVFYVEGGENSKETCNVRIQMKDPRTQQVYYDQTRKIQLVRDVIPVRFEMTSLKPGIYDLHYEFSDAQGKVLVKDFEYYAKPDGKAPWEGTTAGLGDIVPPPWTPVIADANTFNCWGRTYKLGGAGIIPSVVSQDRELLSRPMTLVLNGKPVAFKSELLKQGKSFADYRLTAQGAIPVTVDVHAEFDGLLWCTASVGQKGDKIDSLALDYPFSRKNAHVFDDCSSIYEKVNFSDWQDKTIFNDPTAKPFFWCGDARIGVMGGIDNCRGWYFKDKRHGQRFTVTKDEAVVTLNFIDTPLTLTAPRKIEFYIQATPGKPKEMAAARPAPLHRRITFYASLFYEWKAPGQVVDGYMQQFLNMEKMEHIRWYYYHGTKGSSPCFPWWGWYGSEWNMGGDPALYQQELPAETRAKRDRSRWTWTCMNSRNFFEHKIDMLRWYLSVEKYKVRNLYFDLAWPYPCANTVHGCRWTDEFGHIHSDYDMKALHEFYRRAYIMMKQKNPDALMMGHCRYTRTPSDNFFHVLTVGEGYERQVAEQNNYYEIFKPEILRMLWGYRANEFTIDLGPQIYRTIQVYKRNKLKDFRPDDPKIDKAQRHYLAYVRCHHLETYIYSRQNELQIIQLGKVIEDMGDGQQFYAYWEPECGLKALEKDPRFLYCAYSGNGKVLLIALNDTDKTVTRTLVIEPNLLKLPSNQGKDVFKGGNYEVKDNRIQFTLPPRESQFVLFTK